MIRFGVIGTSWITDEFIKCASLTGDFVLNAVYSRTAVRAKEFADKYSVSNIFTDLNDMVNSDCIDAVYIASPNSHHAPQAILCLNHQKHVLCEKPIATNVKELTEMIAVARENNVVLMEALKTTLLPNFQALKENLPKIGKVRRFLSIKCQYSSRYDLYKLGKEVNTFNPIFANGSLMDIGVYCIYPIVALFGKPNRIQASALLLTSGIDGEGSICFKYDDMDAIAIHSKITNTTLSSEIQGENGSIIIDKISTPEKLTMIFKDGSVEDISRSQPQELMYFEAKEFITLIREGRLESSINSHQLSLAVMGIMDEARQQFGLKFPAD